MDIGHVFQCSKNSWVRLLRPMQVANPRSFGVPLDNYTSYDRDFRTVRRYNDNLLQQKCTRANPCLDFLEQIIV